MVVLALPPINNGGSFDADKDLICTARQIVLDFEAEKKLYQAQSQRQGELVATPLSQSMHTPQCSRVPGEHPPYDGLHDHAIADYAFFSFHNLSWWASNFPAKPRNALL